jgi:hypothetical protein
MPHRVKKTKKRKYYRRRIRHCVWCGWGLWRSVESPFESQTSFRARLTCTDGVCSAAYSALEWDLGFRPAGTRRV